MRRSPGREHNHVIVGAGYGPASASIKEPVADSIALLLQHWERRTLSGMERNIGQADTWATRVWRERRLLARAISAPVCNRVGNTAEYHKVQTGEARDGG